MHGLKPIETIEHGDLIWSRQEFGTEYDHRPVIATKVTPNQEIYEVVVKHSNNSTETFKTTKEHPFWVEGIGWLKASLLEQGMTLLDKHGLPNVTIISQTKLDRKETVYNFEVDDFHTYHIGEFGVWVHNDGCCGVALSTLESYVEKSARGMGKLHRVNENELTQLILDIGYNKDELLKAKSILEYSIKIRKAEKASQPGGRIRCWSSKKG
ncbi:hypothetical protein D6D60_08325 [Moraxella catarrhalis]|nr:hypothetical protein D6D60_08325 [Moraxella catarrhalis]